MGARRASRILILVLLVVVSFVPEVFEQQAVPGLGLAICSTGDDQPYIWKILRPGEDICTNEVDGPDDQDACRCQQSRRQDAVSLMHQREKQHRKDKAQRSSYNHPGTVE